MNSNNTNKSNHNTNTNDLNEEALPNKDNFILDELKNEIDFEDNTNNLNNSDKINAYGSNEARKPIRFDGLTGKPIYEEDLASSNDNNPKAPKKNLHSTKIIITASLVVLLGGGFAIGSSFVNDKKSSKENNPSNNDTNTIDTNNNKDSDLAKNDDNSKSPSPSAQEEEAIEAPSIKKDSGNTNTSDLYNNSSKAKTKNNFIFNSSSSKVTYSDLKNLSSDELEIAKSEILARHGAIFSNEKPNLQKYFNSQKWYKPNPNFSMTSLSTVEKENYELIKADQYVKDAYNASSTIYSDFIFPNSNTEALSSYDVSRLSNWELAVTRNEIYARYGLRFSIECLASYFTSKDWYTPIPGLSNSMPLNSVESKNISLILKEEESREDDYESDISANY